MVGFGEPPSHLVHEAAARREMLGLHPIRESGAFELPGNPLRPLDVVAGVAHEEVDAGRRRRIPLQAHAVLRRSRTRLSRGGANYTSRSSSRASRIGFAS